MSEESRLAFHAVPRIVKTSDDDNPPDECNNSNLCNNCCKPTQYETHINHDDWKPFEQYLAKTRINVNVRQVHSPGNTVV